MGEYIRTGSSSNPFTGGTVSGATNFTSIISSGGTNLQDIFVTYNPPTDYRSSFESDGYLYYGYNLNSQPYIFRTLSSVNYTASGVTNLTTDWTNRTSLSYS